MAKRRRARLILGLILPLATAPVVGLELSAEERAWLTDHPHIRVALSPDYQPISFVDEHGQPGGMVADYLQHVQDELGLEFQWVVPRPKQSQSNDPKVKGVDMVSVFADTPERREHWLFTEPFLEFPLYVIVRDGHAAMRDLRALKGKPVAVVAGYAAQELVVSRYPGARLEQVPDTRSGLQRLAFGAYEAFVSDLPTASWWLNREGLSDLRIAGDAGLKYRLGMAVRGDWPQFHGILAKALAKIDPAERQTIYNRWVQAPPQPDPSLWRALQIALAVMAVIALGLLAMFLWNRSLQRQVAERTQDLHDLFQRMERYHAAIVAMASRNKGGAAALSDALQGISAIAAEALGASRVSVWLLRNEGRTLECAELYQADTGAHSRGALLQSEDYPRYFEALTSARAIPAESAADDPRTSEFRDGYLRETGVVSMLDAAIRLGGQTKGVLCIEQTKAPRRWSQDEISFAGEVADQVAQAYAHAVLARHRDQLEQLVDERTGDLQRANTELREEIDTRARIEAELRVSEQRFRSLVQMAPSVILGLSPEGHILEFNPEAERVFGRQREAVMDLDFASLFVPVDWRQPLKDRLRDMLEGQPAREYEMPVIDAEGKLRLFAWASERMIGPDGQALGLVSVGSDITRRKEVERELLHAKEAAESADRIKSMFVASMSHELRTPLNSIIGFTDVVLQGLSGELNEKQKDQLGRAYRSAKHLLTLISDVIDISKIEAGYVETFCEPFEIGKVLEEAAASVHHQAAQKGLALHVESCPSLSVLADRKRFYQCVLNLVSNAVKYSERGRVEIGAEPCAEGVRVWVRDTGIGIDAAGLTRIFQPFERINSRLKINTPGTGLGLYLTRKIMRELLHGDVGVESEPERGSTFTLRLPLCPPQAASAPAPAEQPGVPTPQQEG